MPSSEVRQVLVVLGAFAAGAALAFVPLSSASLPYQNTGLYFVWGFLIATLCGTCPVVWSHGRQALNRLPKRPRFIQEAVGYGIFAVLLVGISGVVAVVVFGRGRPLATLPYMGPRFDIVYVAVVVAVAPSILAMFRVAAAIRHDTVRAADLVAWRVLLQSQLAGLGAVVALGTLTTASFRMAILAAYPSRAGDYPVAGVLLFGAWFTGILALVYVPPSERLRRQAQTLVDRLFPIPDYFVGDWQQQLQRRRDLTSALRLDETSQISIQNALIIAGPLITSALTLLIPAH